MKSFRELMQYVLAVTERRRLLVPLPFGVAKLQAHLLQLLPTPLLTPDQVELLRADNVVSQAAQAEGRTLAGLGIEPTALEAVVPSYLWRFRKAGQFRGRVAYVPQCDDVSSRDHRARRRGGASRDRRAGEVLVDCVEGGASVSFMLPFGRADAKKFFDKVIASVARDETVLVAAKLDGRIVGTVQLGLDMPPNQPHRGDIKKLLVHRAARRHGLGAALMQRAEAEAKARGRSCWCSTPPATKPSGSMCAGAGSASAWCRTTRCGRRAGSATRCFSGSGSEGRAKQPAASAASSARALSPSRDRRGLRPRIP